ncbi:response regulator transcription factor [Oceanobacillus sp. CAU 1775]
MITVLLAEDHAIVRSGVKLLINNQPDMKVLSEAVDGEEAVQLALTTKPDIVIMDLNMPKLNGFEAMKRIKEANCANQIIVLTMHEDRAYIFRALQAGASSYILKSHEENDLIEAIRAVNRGEAYLYPEATKFVLEDYLNKEKEFVKLTDREDEVLSYLVMGYTNREVAEQLFLSVKTVEAHRSSIMGKLNLKTRSDLVKYALKHGYFDFHL